ncbi:MAG: UbiX family flavin prenyltransferase [Candidatus Methanomethylicaceae archaeon]
MRIILAITGASGSIYGYRLLEKLTGLKAEVSIIVTRTGLQILEDETGLREKDLSKFGKVYRDYDLRAPMASGSYLFDAMVIVPCSMKTLGCIANGISSSLITRAADVALKERRKLILVIRETPLNLVHLRNMINVTEAGGLVMPASPGFYHRPKTLEGLVDHLVGKIMDQLEIKHNLYRRWGDTDGS